MSSPLEIRGLRTGDVWLASKLTKGFGGDEWDVMHGEYFDKSFHDVLDGKSIARITSENKQRTGKSFALDLMGYGDILRRNVHLDGGVAVALSDQRLPKDKRSDEEDNIDFVEGNILHNSTWAALQRWLDRQEVEDKHFDLIICRPISGFNNLGYNSGVYITLIQKAWRLLSPHNGALLTQIPDRPRVKPIFGEKVIADWVKLLNATQGVRANYSYRATLTEEGMVSYPALGLTKSEGAPAKLPLLPTEK